MISIAEAIEDLKTHDHSCLIYETIEEQLAAVIPYIKIGLEKGEKCVYIVDESTAQLIKEELAKTGVDVVRYETSGALVIASKRETYLREGHFDPETMIDFLKAATEEAKDSGFSALRVTGEMTWALGSEPGVERLMEYENKLNYVLPEYDLVAICQYHKQKFDPAIIQNVVNVHPLVIYRNRVWRNYEFIEPDKLLGPNKEEARLQSVLESMMQIDDMQRDLKAKYETLFETAPAIILILDYDGKIFDLNGKAEEFYRAPKKDLIGKNYITTFVPKKFRGVIVADIKKVLDGKPSSGFVSPVTMPSGGERFISWNVDRVQTNSNVGGIIAIGEDVTEKKQAETAMEKAIRDISDERDKVHQYLDIVAVMIVNLDKNGRVTLINKKGLDVLGCSEKEAIGKNWFDNFLPERNRDGVKDVFDQLMSGRVELVEHYENPVVNVHGEERMIAWHNTFIQDSNGDMVGTLSSGQDITDRKEAEQQIERLSRFPSENPAPVFRVGKDGKLIYANHSAEPLLAEWGIKVDQEAPDFLRDLAAKVLGSGRIVEDVELAHECKTFSFTVVPIVKGNYANFYGVDATDRKRAEAQIKLLNEGLEERVRIRTAALETANKDLEAFTYSVSHNLRPPLRAVDGFARIIKQDYQAALDVEGNRLLDIVMNSALNMERLIDDLLAFSRSGRKEVKKSAIDSDRIIQSIFDEQKLLEPERAIFLNAHKLPEVQADPAMMKQVWENLISNAIKFTTNEKRAEIEIGSFEKDDQDVFWIKDNGVGFDMKYKDKLFVLFERLNTDEVCLGTGVGLAIVKKIIKRNGGRVWGEGEVGKGATMYFSLPKERAGEKDVAA